MDERLIENMEMQSNRIKKLRTLIDQLDSLMAQAEPCMDIRSLTDQRDLVIELLSKSESFTVEVRNLALWLTPSLTRYNVERIASKEYGGTLTVTAEGWLLLDIPALPRKKAKVNNVYIKGCLRSLFDSFIDEHPNFDYKRFRFSVLIFENVVSSKHVFRLVDNDNWESNAITNLFADYFLVDDGPQYLDNYVYSTLGNEDRTHVYLVPRSDFAMFLSKKRI